MTTILRGVLLAAILGLAAAAGLAAGGGPASAQQTTVIPVGDLYFCDPSFGQGTCTTTIRAGDTVVWDLSAANVPHTTTGPIWDSGLVNPGGSFQFTFDETGSYAYQCDVHPSDMQGVILVEDALPEPTAPPGGDGSTVDEPTGDDGGDTGDSIDSGEPETIAPAGTGPGTDGGTSPGWWFIAALGALGAIVTGAGAFALRRTTRNLT